MPTVPVTVEGKEVRLYADNFLYEQINAKVIPRVRKKDADWVWIVDGEEGSGKSVFAMQVAKLLDSSFNLNQVCMSPEDFIKTVLSSRKGSCIIYDEAFTGLSSRASLSEINNLIVQLMMEMRQKNLFVIIVLPTFYMLDKYVALFRAKGLFHVYTKGGNRGRWAYFNRRRKKLLYIYCKKNLSYSWPKAAFVGRFMDTYCVDEKAYKRKKADALMKKKRMTKGDVFKFQRDTLLHILADRFKMSHYKIVALLKEYNFDVTRQTVMDSINHYKEEINLQKVYDQEMEEERERINKKEIENAPNPSMSQPADSDDRTAVSVSTQKIKRKRGRPRKDAAKTAAKIIKTVEPEDFTDGNEPIQKKPSLASPEEVGPEPPDEFEEEGQPEQEPLEAEQDNLGPEKKNLEPDAGQDSLDVEPEPSS